MAFAQAGDISAILNAFSQLGQANAQERQRDLQAQADQRAGRAALGGAIGSIGGAYAFGPIGGAAGGALGARLLGGSQTGMAPIASSAGSGFQMGQAQQAYQQQQDDRSAIARAGAYLNPPPQVGSTVVNTPAQQQFSDAPEGAPQSTPAMSRRETTVYQPPPNPQAAVGELFNAGQLGPAISLMGQMQKTNAGQAYTVVDDKPDGKYQPGQIPRSMLGGSDIPSGAMVQRNEKGLWNVVWKPQNESVSRSANLEMLKFVRDQQIARYEGQQIKPEDAALEQLYRQQLSAPKVLPDGSSVPGIKFDGDQGFDAQLKKFYEQQKTNTTTPAPSPTGAPLEVPNREMQKPLTPEQQQTMMLSGESRRTINAAMDKFMPGGKIDSAEIAKGYFGIPWTDARMAQSDLVTAMGNIIYLKSGKAINQEEAKRMAISYLPSPYDSDQGKKAALERIKALSQDTEWLSQYGMRPEVAKEFYARQEKASPQAKKNDALKSKYGLE